VGRRARLGTHALKEIARELRREDPVAVTRGKDLFVLVKGEYCTALGETVSGVPSCCR
jgi:hypothetical protein